MKKNFFQNKIIITILTLAVIFIVAIVLIKSEKPKEYKLSKVQKNTIVETVEASGIINPVKTVSIGSQVSGMIQNIYVDFNSKVKQGQLLAQIDPSLFEAQVEKAQGDLNSARANYQKAKSLVAYDAVNYKRYKELYQKRYVSKNDLDVAETDYKADLAAMNSTKALIDQTAATLRNNQTNLRYTRIVSPVNGVVVSRSVDVGQTVAASFQTPTLFLVAQDLTKMQIEVSVSEADIGKIKVGQKVDYTLDGYPNETFKGTVSQVRISPTTVSNVVTYTVIVSVNNDNGILKPGMTANASIITSTKENVVCVENAALRFTPSEITGGKKFKKQGIWILRKNKPTRINIKMGITDSENTEIISKEIKEGDEVIIGSLKKKGESNSSNMRPPRMF